MRKYMFIFKATLMESLQYVMNIILGFLTYFMIIFIFIHLWKYMYSDSSSLISGYSIQQMIWYVIFTEAVWFGGRHRTLTFQVSNNIKSGTIAYSINKPYHYMLYIISKYLGDIVIQITLFFGAGILIGLIFIGPIPDFRLYHLPFAIASFILGIMINAFICISICVLSFWIEDSTPFRWIYDKLIIVIGTLFPLELFPIWAQPLIKFSPIYVVNYGPAKLMVDFSFVTAAKIFLAQMIYIIITLLILFSLFRKGVKKLNVNGG